MHVFAKDLARRARCARGRCRLSALALCARRHRRAHARRHAWHLQGQSRRIKRIRQVPGALGDNRDLRSEDGEPAVRRRRRFRFAIFPRALSGLRIARRVPGTDRAVVIADGRKTGAGRGPDHLRAVGNRGSRCASTVMSSEGHDQRQPHSQAGKETTSNWRGVAAPSGAPAAGRVSKCQAE